MSDKFLAIGFNGRTGGYVDENFLCEDHTKMRDVAEEAFKEMHPNCSIDYIMIITECTCCGFPAILDNYSTKKLEVN